MKVFVLGLDGAPPELVFGEWLDSLPNLKKLVGSGLHGTLESTIPPSTTIAWNALASGQDASGLGIYSYTYREGNKTRLYNSLHIKARLLWDILSDAGKKVTVLNVPLTYPPKKVNGHMVTDFLTPDASCEFTYPPSLKQELHAFLGKDYQFDATDEGLGGYKSVEKTQLLKRIYEMTDIHLKTLKHMLKKDWDFLICDILGSDRMLHTFLSYYDKSHPKYTPSAFGSALPEFFTYLDREIGEILSLLPKDTLVVVCSDHGIRKVLGKINLNDWLMREGYLFLKAPLRSPVKFDFSLVDWSKTKAYAIGSYQGRIYFNLEGRDEHGVVKRKEYESLQKELTEKLTLIPDDKGKTLETKVFRPQDIYSGPHKDKAPDLFVYFDNLVWGVNNDFGNEGLHSQEDTVGATDGGHSPDGLIIVSGPGIPKKDLGRMKITDVACFILDRMGVPVPREIDRLGVWHALL
ncbi:MAG: alkaline phosphatase family protein [Candidatus Aenigmarchaeota archaeon]|nr:alkaline phosphatase family protein [Candidatus Aenigmarchaeota archaeon]